MIYDLLENLPRYRGMDPGLDECMDWLLSNDLSALSNGNREISPVLTVKVMDAAPRPADQLLYEMHHHHMDLQIDLQGAECFELALQGDADGMAYDEAADCQQLRGEPVAEARLGGGRFILFLPDEMHKPGIFAGDKAIRKLVAKVLVKSEKSR